MRLVDVANLCGINIVPMPGIDTANGTKSFDARLDDLVDIHPGLDHDVRMGDFEDVGDGGVPRGGPHGEVEEQKLAVVNGHVREIEVVFLNEGGGLGVEVLEQPLLRLGKAPDGNIKTFWHFFCDAAASSSAIR